MQVCSETPLQAVTCCLRTSLEHVLPSHWQNVPSSVTLGSRFLLDPAAGRALTQHLGREQEGRGLLSSGIATDSSETSLSCVNPHRAVDHLLVLRIAL